MKEMKDMMVMEEKEVRKESLWLIGFILLCSLMIIGLSSCSNDDAPVTTTQGPGPLAQTVNGVWYGEYDAQGKDEVSSTTEVSTTNATMTLDY